VARILLYFYYHVNEAKLLGVQPGTVLRLTEMEFTLYQYNRIRAAGVRLCAAAYRPPRRYTMPSE
jgi:hypothetical protein